MNIVIIREGEINETNQAIHEPGQRSAEDTAAMIGLNYFLLYYEHIPNDIRLYQKSFSMLSQCAVVRHESTKEILMIARRVGMSLLKLIAWKDNSNS